MVQSHLRYLLNCISVAHKSGKICIQKILKCIFKISTRYLPIMSKIRDHCQIPSKSFNILTASCGGMIIWLLSPAYKVFLLWIQTLYYRYSKDDNLGSFVEYKLKSFLERFWLVWYESAVCHAMHAIRRKIRHNTGFVPFVNFTTGCKQLSLGLLWLLWWDAGHAKHVSRSTPRTPSPLIPIQGFPFYRQ